MSNRPIPLPGLVRLLNAQAGVLTRAQALGVGVTRARIGSLLATGHWCQVRRGVYSVNESLSGMARAWVGVLVGGANACVGGLGAARLLGLTPSWPHRLEIWTDRQVEDDGLLVFRRGQRSREGDPPRTGAAATVVDLAAELTEDRLVNLLAEAAFKRLATPDQILAELASRRRHPRRKLLRTLLGDVSQGAMSPLEVRFLRDVERAHGLPEGTRQARLGAPVDVWYSAFQLVVELDGRQFHGGARGRHDRDLDHRRAAADIITMRFTWQDIVSRPCEVATQIAAVLAGHGWSEGGHGCPRCDPTRHLSC